MKRISWVNLLAGIWLVVASFVIGAAAISSVPTANDIVLGLLLLLTSWWILASAAPSSGAAWFQVVCGLWLIVSPFVLKFGNAKVLTVNAIVIGGIAALVGLAETTMVTERTA
jgi:hypothetical protein